MQTADELDELPGLAEMEKSARPEPGSALSELSRTELEKQFLPRIDALRSTRTCAAAESLMPPSAFRQNVLFLKEGMTIEPKDLIERLVAAGYERVDVVEARGQCALRGGIVDVFPVGRAGALRLEFFDDELDSLRDFDPMSQRSVSRVNGAVILPAHEALLTQEQAVAAADRFQAALA